MNECSGTLDDHCCWIDGAVCRFLEENTVPGRRWACGLLRRLGSWEAVHADAGYVEHVKPKLERLAIEDCDKWPRRGERCAVCGVIGG